VAAAAPPVVVGGQRIALSVFGVRVRRAAGLVPAVVIRFAAGVVAAVELALFSSSLATALLQITLGQLVLPDDGHQGVLGM